MSHSMSSAPSDAEETQLILRIARRDRAAFASLFSRVAPRVKGYLIRVGEAPGRAEELTQDVMLTVWRKAELFDPAKAGALTWIFVIARNQRIDSLRGEHGYVSYGIAPPEGLDETAPSAPDALLGAEREARVRKAMAGLSAEQREVVTLSFFDDHAHPEIARRLGLPLGTVKSRLRLAMEKLRAVLEDVR